MSSGIYCCPECVVSPFESDGRVCGREKLLLLGLFGYSPFPTPRVACESANYSVFESREEDQRFQGHRPSRFISFRSSLAQYALMACRVGTYLLTQ